MAKPMVLGLSHDTCLVCGKDFQMKANGKLFHHGHPAHRCPGAGTYGVHMKAFLYGVEHGGVIWEVIAVEGNVTTARSERRPMTAACRNCGWQDARPTVDLCWPCYKYQHRTGRPRPAAVVLRHLARTIARDLDEAACL